MCCLLVSLCLLGGVRSWLLLFVVVCRLLLLVAMGVDCCLLLLLVVCRVFIVV